MQKTLVLIKPDWIQRWLSWEVISRLEKKWLKLVAMKMMKLSDALLRDHYSHIADKPFFPWISNFMQSSPIIAMAWEWKDAVSTVRQICWITKSREAMQWTIRWDFAMSIQCNVVHSSEDLEAAGIELERFFETHDFFDYKKDEYIHVYNEEEIA